MIYGIYRLLTRLAFWFAFPFFIVYSLVTGRHRESLKHRLGFYDRSLFTDDDKTFIWFHAASVGEVKAAGILIKKLNADCTGIKIVLTVVTEQGLKVALNEIGNEATCLYAPLDFPGTVARVARIISPAIYICLETELWPNLLKELHVHNAKMFLLNARISEHSSRRYLLFRSLISELLSSFSGIAAITNKDAERLLKLGAIKENLYVSGNVKYDLSESSDPGETRAYYRKVLGLNDRQIVIVAGSTHTGEEEILVRTFRSLLKKFGDMILILAPRHLSRLPAITEQMSSLDIGHDLLSNIKTGERKHNVVIVDTMGELARIYSVASYIFCGGSLVDRGGHNLLEAANWGVPVLYGPNMKDFQDAQMILEENGGGIMIRSGAELTTKIRELAENKDLYNHVAKGAGKSANLQHGVSEKQLAPIIETLRKMSC